MSVKALPAMSSAFAEHFAKAKPQFLESNSSGCTIVQTGAAALPALPQPIPWPTSLSCDEPLIETFVVDLDGNCMPTGDDQDVVAAWRPAAEMIARHVLDEAATHGIRIAGSSYLTASVTPSDQIVTSPHFDDDMLVPGEGVGLVAIVGGIGGPRVAAEAIAHGPVRPPTQLQLADAAAGSLMEGTIDHHVADSDQIVVFPQFGQLHSGPAIPNPDPNQMRYLIVFRSTTTPT